ncbi:MAG: hypothetical protein HOL15_11195 [Nitrospinaceae bacterium]|nr:hypothetical protein [Nitrospinaceae bacterium]MBT5867306.1 hypothetical protein [Nitrospinaceae bacterium]
MKALCFCSVLVMGLLVSGCGGGDGEDVVEKSSFQMPVKENTWVRKEMVSKSKEDFFASVGKKGPEVAADAVLLAKLKSPAKLTVNTQAECVEQAEILDRRRIAVQKRGGAWHAYEKVAEAKPYSNYGMQLDSQTNRLVFSLKHLCINAHEFRLDGWGQSTVKSFESLGKEGFRKHFLFLGNAPADVEKWVRFSEYSIKHRGRKVAYSKIGETLARAKTMIDFYEGLSQSKIEGETSLKTFLTEGSSLLSVINESFTTDPQMVLALADEAMLPFEDLKGQM